MSAAHLKFGVPDIDLPRADGSTINPSVFAGHALLVVFFPTAFEREAAELAEYGKLSPPLSAFDCWLVTVREQAIDEQSVEKRLPVAAIDPDGSAWAAFRAIVSPELELERSEGATFLFARGGSLDRVWPGIGHAKEVMAELAHPCSGVEDMSAKAEGLDAD